MKLEIKNDTLRDASQCEKDFVCLTGRDDEDESDMYPHPHAGEESC